jgi:predicted phosphodiesterase
MRPISWIHISDIHMRASDAWSQDVVLRAMCEDIARQRRGGASADFILATGDIAFSGKVEEYRLAVEFFDAISVASGVPKERIFCIPGNHDIDRERQKMCFLGTRGSLQDQNRVDLFLVPGEDKETLLKRQENYRKFQNSYFTGQDRKWTDDGLGYVSRITIDDVRLAIIGVDSAWLAEGGVGDHGKLLIGERQVINAINLAQGYDDPPHIIVGMAHHPFHLLREFDRRPIQSRIERACHFFHCGHLHEPEARNAGYGGTGCLTLSAGASFETRHSHNTYSLVTLDLLRALRTVKTIRYNPSIGTFFLASQEEYSIEVTPSDACSVSELAQAMKAYNAALTPWAYYLSALLLDQKSEIPIPAQTGHTFGSFAVLEAQPDSDLRRRTTDFMAFRNALRVLYKRVPLSDIFVQHGDAVGQYGAALKELSEAQPTLRVRLAEREGDAQMLASAQPSESFSHTGALLAELAGAQDWDLLREQAARHLGSSDRTVAIQAKRMLALCFAQSEEAMDKIRATELYRSLWEEGVAELGDVGNLATLLIDTGNLEEAKVVVLNGIEKFAHGPLGRLIEIGQRIVEATGDRAFRRQLDAPIASERTRD